MVLSDFTICHTSFLIGDNDKELNMYRFPVKATLLIFSAIRNCPCIAYERSKAKYSETNIIGLKNRQTHMSICKKWEPTGARLVCIQDHL